MNIQVNHQPNSRHRWLISRSFYRNVAWLSLITILINLVAASYAQSPVIQPNTVETYIAQESAADYLKRGNDRFNEGDNQGAIADLTQAQLLNPNDIDIYYSRGLAYLYLGNCQEAMADFNQTLSLNPEYAEAYVNRGIAFAGLRDYPKAIADFNQAIKRKPTLAIAYINRAIAHRNLGNSKVYYEDYQKAAEIMATGTADYNHAPVYIVHYREPLNLDRASSPVPDDITVWFAIHQEISQGIHFAAAGTEGIKPPPMSYPDPFQKPWLESLMVRYKSKEPVWLNTLIKQYSEWIERNPGKKFEEVSIIHLGINEGHNDAMRIAKDYSKKWKHPVFVVETFPPLLFGELTESLGGWASRFPFHLSLVIPAWFYEKSSYDLAGVTQFLREQGHTVKREVFWSGSVVLLGNSSEFSQFSAKTHSGVKIFTRGGTLDREAIEYLQKEGIQLDLYQPPPNKKPDFVVWITDRNKRSQFEMYLSSETARSLTPFAREVGRLSLNSLDVLVNIPLKELLIYGDHNLYKQLPLDQNPGSPISGLKFPIRYSPTPKAPTKTPTSTAFLAATMRQGITENSSERQDFEERLAQSRLKALEDYNPDGLPPPPPPGAATLPRDISEAIANGEIEVEAEGTGDRSSLRLRITNKTSQWTQIGIPPGTTFNPGTLNTQNMMISNPKEEL